MMDNQKKFFSLVIGGPFYQFYLWSGLAKNPLLHCKRRIAVICLFAWLPLLLLALISGVAFNGVKVPFIFDINVHVRFLISLALLIFAEVIAHERLGRIVQQFVNSNIVALNDRKKFDSIITSAMRLSSSIKAEGVLLILVLIVGHSLSGKHFASDVTNWYESTINGTIQLTLPGYWYVYISLPLFQFMVLRWYYRMAIWYRFLWQVSKLPLQLNSLHPDRAGGIGFLADSVSAFEPLLLAHSVLLAGMVINRIWHAGATLSQFQGDIIIIMAFLMLLPLLPLMFFAFSLIKTKRNGTLAYDIVASNYVNNFREKWIGPESVNSKALLGTPDIQSLADLTNSFDVSSKMSILPFGRPSIILILILTALPFVPLIFTIMPLEKIVSQAISVIF